MLMLKNMYYYLRASLSTNEKGQGMVEYSLIIALIAVIIIAAFAVLNPTITQLFTDVTNTITNRNGTT